MRLELGNLSLNIGRRVNTIIGAWPHRIVLSNCDVRANRSKYTLWHYDVIQWKHFLRYWPVNSPHKGQWRWPLMFSLICAWLNCYGNNREAGDLRRHRTHYDVTLMVLHECDYLSMPTCCRCLITTVDQETGKKHSRQKPLRDLRQWVYLLIMMTKWKHMFFFTYFSLLALYEGIHKDYHTKGQ